MKRKYALLKAADKKALPALPDLPGSTQEVLEEYANNKDLLVQAKWFSPYTGQDWYVTAFDGDDTCFGLLRGPVSGWGPFSLSETTAMVNEHGGILVERDILFEPKRFSEFEKFD